MSSIPLPALDVRPPQQQESPLDQYARLQQLQNAPLQRQALQQQIQAGQLDIQQKQQQIQDGQTLRSISPTFVKKDSDGNVTGYDFDGFFNKAASSGVSPTTLASLQKGISDASIAKSNATKAQLENEQTLNTQAFQHLEGLRGTQDPAQRQQLWTSALQWAQQNGDALGIKPGTLPQQAPDDSGLNAIEASLGMHAQQLADASKVVENNLHTQQGNEAGARAAEINSQMQSGGTSAMADARYRNILMKQQLGQPVSPEDKAFVAAYKNQKTLVPVANFNLQNAGATAPGANGEPNDMIQGLASGRYKWNDVVSMRTPMSVKNAIASEVAKINPNFDTSTYSLETKAAEKATSGPWADTRIAYNTALDHSELLLEAAKALQNNDVRKLNSLKNTFGSEFGWSGPVTFDAIANAYNHEVTSVVSKGHMTDKEVETGGAVLPSNANLQTIQSVVGAYKSLMTSKRNELDKVIKAGAGNKANGVLGVGSTSDNQQQPPGAPMTITLPSGKKISID